MKSTNGSSAYNLLRHLALRHNVNLGIDLSSFRSKKRSTENQQVISQQQRDEIDRLLLNCIIYGGLPYNHFSHSWFRDLFDKMCPGYSPPDRRTFAKRVKHRYHEYIGEIKRLLPRDRPIAFTTDVWKSPKRHHYICLTGHVFNDQMKPVSLLLSFRRLTDRKISKNLNEFIFYELKRFGLDVYSYAGITTDGGSDIKAATSFGDFGPRFPCVAHLFNLVIHHGLCLWKRPDPNQ